MSIQSLNFRSNLSCMFVVTELDEPTGNYDYLEANGHQASHTLPQLELAPSRFDTLPKSYQEALKEQAYRALAAKMTTSAADITTMAKQYRLALTDEALAARDTANRPDSIPSDLNVVSVDHWEQEKRVFIPAKAPKGASLGELVAANTKPDGFMVNLPMRPIGTVLGTINAEAWRKGEAANIAVHAPQPLPPYSVPQRSLTSSEAQVAEWLLTHDKAKPATRSSRMARLAARYWDKGDGHSGEQPVMAANAAHRALGRIAIAQRNLAVG